MAANNLFVDVSILLKDKAGFHFKDDGGPPWQCTVPKGELVIEQTKEEIPPIESDKPPPNYRLYRDDEYVVLHCGTLDVCPLGDKEMEYLLAVEPTGTRLQEYLKPDEIKKEKLDLVIGDVVMFKMKVRPDAPVSIVKGVIRYIGPIEEKLGTHFGIEIQEQKYRGKGMGNGDPYFRCGSKDAVFVSIDKITKRSQYPIDKKPAPAKSAITSEPTGANPKGGMAKGSLNIKGKAEAFDSQTSFHARTDPNHQSKFKVDDRVVVKSVKDEVFNGTVKWVGTTRVRNERDRYSTVVVAVGVDVEKKFLSTDKHFPRMYLDMTASRGQELFKVPFGHTRLFFREEYGVVLHVEEYAKQQQEAHALKREAEEARKMEKASRDKMHHHQAGSNKEEITKLNEEILQLQTSIENLQLEKDTQQRTAKQQEQQWRIEKQQLLEEQEHLRELIKQVQEQLETDKQALKEENGQLKYENEDLRREITDLREAHRELQQETEKKEQVQAQLQSQVGLFSIENMKLKGQVKQLEESKYWDKNEEYCQLQDTNENLRRNYQRKEDECYQLQKSCNALVTSNEDKEERIRCYKLLVKKMEADQASKQNELARLENSWKISSADIEYTKTKLGTGGWAKVTIGKFRGKDVAVKRFYKVLLQQKEQSSHYMELLHREINTMSQLRHPNLLQFIGAVLDHPKGNPMIITEVMDTSLRSAYERKELTTDPGCRPVILSIMRDVAVGLNYLHCLPDPIIHRDVSSANVLLESKGHNKWKTKISDFGSAKLARAAVTEAPGAAVYSAPESHAPSGKKQTPKMDSYSYGVLLCEVITCRFPVTPGVLETLSLQVKVSSPQLHELIVSCINEEPDKRPTMSEIIVELDRFIA